MIKGRKMTIIGIGVLIGSAMLASFTGKKDDEKKKSYQVIHHSKGEVVMHDTILPMSSTYTVENFLADKGIDDDNVKIVKIPSMGNLDMMFHGEDGEHSEQMIKEFTHDIEIDGEEGAVMIICEMDDEGNMKAKKIVNGEEVELTAEEIEKMTMHKGIAGEHHKMMKMKMCEMHSDGTKCEHMGEMNCKHAKGENGKEVKIMCEMDDEGNMKVKKIVDGVEVEMTEDELEKMQMHKNMSEEHEMMIEIEVDEAHEGENRKEVKIICEMDDEGNMKAKKIVDGVEVEISPEELEEMKMHKGMKGEHHKMMKIKMCEEYCEKKCEHHGEMDCMHGLAMMDGAEDFTIVIVSENIDESAMENERTMNAKNLSIYPNPNGGTFTLKFNQEEKAKTTVSITDSQGKEVFEENLGKFSGEYKKEIDLKKFGTGVYIINVQQGDEVTTEKIIVE